MDRVLQIGRNCGLVQCRVMGAFSDEELTEG